MDTPSLTDELLRFIDLHAEEGLPLTEAYVQAYPDAAELSYNELVSRAMEAWNSPCAKERFDFLEQERRTIGALSLRDHLDELARLEREGGALTQRMVARGGPSDSAAAALFSHRARILELRGKVSGLHTTKAEVGVSAPEGKARFVVDWGDGV